MAMIQTETSPLETLVDALVGRNFDRMEALMAPAIFFHALIPPGTRCSNESAGARRAFEGWFGQCEDVELVSSAFGTVGDRRSANYTLHFVEDGKRYVCQQQIYANVSAAGQIERIDLLCSGFRPLE